LNEAKQENSTTDAHRCTQMRAAPITVTYDGVVFGVYSVDLLVKQTIIVELKAVMALDNLHTAPCLNYLKATGLRFCMLLNLRRSRP